VHAGKQLEDENRLVKDLYRTTLTETDTERNRLQAELEQAHTAATMKDRRVRELEEHVKTLEARTAAVEDKADTVELHRRIQELELSLAEAKLQIVDLNCQAQVQASTTHACVTAILVACSFRTRKLCRPNQVPLDASHALPSLGNKKPNVNFGKPNSIKPLNRNSIT